MSRSAPALRLAALYTAAFALAVVVLGAVTLLTTRAALSQQFDARIHAEAVGAGAGVPHRGAVGRRRRRCSERDRTPGALDYGLDGPDGAPIAGRLAGRGRRSAGRRCGCSTASGRANRSACSPPPCPAATACWSATTTSASRRCEQTVLAGLRLGVRRAWWCSASWAATASAAACTGGSRRSPAPPRRSSTATSRAACRCAASDDDLDRLAATFNRMLDRISALMESLRQVSNDIAHDLRTPLTRLRQRLEASRTATTAPERPRRRSRARWRTSTPSSTPSPPCCASPRSRAARAAPPSGPRPDGARPHRRRAPSRRRPRTPASARRSRRRAAARRRRPRAAHPDAGQPGGKRPAPRRRAGAGARACRRGEARAPCVAVADDGPGVPAAERERLFDRFYRLERSRSTPGSGLGLALVAAVARLHGASVSLADAGPGPGRAGRLPRLARGRNIGVSQCGGKLPVSLDRLKAVRRGRRPDREAVRRDRRACGGCSVAGARRGAGRRWRLQDRPSATAARGPYLGGDSAS